MEMKHVMNAKFGKYKLSCSTLNKVLLCPVRFISDRIVESS